VAHGCVFCPPMRAACVQPHRISSPANASRVPAPETSTVCVGVPLMSQARYKSLIQQHKENHDLHTTLLRERQEAQDEEAQIQKVTASRSRPPSWQSWLAVGTRTSCSTGAECISVGRLRNVFCVFSSGLWAYCP
jgi:hypothetical protein